jgi:hypothetical protein
MKGTAVLALALVVGAVAPAHAEDAAVVGEPELDLGFHVEIGGGSVLKWDAFDETGNSFGGLLLLKLADFEVGLGASVVLPDSRTQADFAMLWVEGRYHILGRPTALGLSPYVLAGLGMSLGDDFDILPSGFIPARWSRDTNVALHLGAGLRWGASEGMYVSAEARAVNHTHLGLQLLVGYAFP